MSRTDSIVRRSGQLVSLERVTDFEIGPDGQVTELETEMETVRAVISDPTEKDEQRHEGRLSVGSLRLTFESDVDVSADRDGQRDRIRHPVEPDGSTTSSTRLYEAVEVSRDKHPLTGTEKLTVLVDERGGREP